MYSSTIGSVKVGLTNSSTYSTIDSNLSMGAASVSTTAAGGDAVSTSTTTSSTIGSGVSGTTWAATRVSAETGSTAGGGAATRDRKSASISTSSVRISSAIAVSRSIAAGVSTWT